MSKVAMIANGAPVEAETLLRMEIRRARTMMSLIMRKLGPQGMADLFAEEIAQHSKAEQNWHKASGGRFTESSVQAHITEGSAQEFVHWFFAGYSGPNAMAMQRAHPEHLGAIPAADGRVDILEITGHTGRPAKLHLRIVPDWNGVPIPLDPAMPHRMMGRFETEDGETCGYLLHQFADAQPGFNAKMSIYWAAATDADLVQGHVDHLLVEFHNWFQMYVASRSQNGDLMPVALAC